MATADVLISIKVLSFLENKKLKCRINMVGHMNESMNSPLLKIKKKHAVDVALFITFYWDWNNFLSPLKTCRLSEQFYWLLWNTIFLILHIATLPCNFQMVDFFYISQLVFIIQIKNYGDMPIGKKHKKD